MKRNAAGLVVAGDRNPNWKGGLAQISSAEQHRAQELEQVIERGLSTFVETGNALLEIRDARLYRAKFNTFEAYCRERWGMSRFYAHRLIDAAEIAEMLPIGNIPPAESMTRELTPLKAEPEKLRETWSAVQAVAGDKATAAIVRGTVKALSPVTVSSADFATIARESVAKVQSEIAAEQEENRVRKERIANAPRIVPENWSREEFNARAQRMFTLFDAIAAIVTLQDPATLLREIPDESRYRLQPLDAAVTWLSTLQRILSEEELEK